MRNRLFKALLVVGGTSTVLAPVTLIRASPATAECATCCAQTNATCVICGSEKCVVNPGYYEGKIGPDPCGEEAT